MRNIIMKSISAGPDQPPRYMGQEASVPKAEAALLVVGGYAEYAKIQPPETATVKTPENKVIAPPESRKGSKK